MKRFRYGFDSLFLGACLLYAVNRWGVKPHTSNVFFHGTFNDLLLIPAALPLLLWIQRVLGLRTHDKAPSWPEILGHLVVWSLLSEWILPRFVPRITGDAEDVLAYAVGALVAGLWWESFYNNSGFDRLAGVYGWMERLCAGNLMQKARTTFELPSTGKVLLAGEGHGRFLEVLLRRNPGLEITCLDGSAKMLEATRARIRHQGLSETKVVFLHQDILDVALPPETYDWIVTNFFLDCFNGAHLEQVVSTLSRAAKLRAGWLVTDFQIPEAGWKKRRAEVIVWLMIRFFRVVTGLRADVLENPDTHLENAGFTCRKRHEYDGGLVYASLWERKPE